VSLGISWEDLEPAEVAHLCRDPAFRTLARWCLRDELKGGVPPQLDFKGDTYDPLSDPLDDPLAEELDECPD
jgi:hypothetical protein